MRSKNSDQTINDELMSHSQCSSAPLEWEKPLSLGAGLHATERERTGTAFFYYIKTLNISTEMLLKEKKKQPSLTLHTAAAWLAASTLVAP